MTKQTEAMKLALEALEYEAEYQSGDVWPDARTAIKEALAEQPAQQEPVGKMGMYEHKCPNVTGHRGPSFVCQKAGHGVGQNSYCKGCICPEALNTSQPAPVQQGWPSDCLVSEKAKQSGFDLSPMPNLLYTVRGNHAQLVNFARAMLATAPQPAQQQEPEYKGWYCAHCQRGVDGSEVTYNEQHTVCGRVITDDLPPKPQQEPYGYVSTHTSGLMHFNKTFHGVYRDTATEIVAVYTSPPAQRKPLMDEEVYKIYRDCGDLNVRINIARAIEAAHGITGEQK